MSGGDVWGVWERRDEVLEGRDQVGEGHHINTNSFIFFNIRKAPMDDPCATMFFGEFGGGGGLDCGGWGVNGAGFGFKMGFHLLAASASNTPPGI